MDAIGDGRVRSGPYRVVRVVRRSRSRSYASEVVNVLEELVEANGARLMVLLVTWRAAKEGGEEAVGLEGQVVTRVRLRDTRRHMRCEHTGVAGRREARGGAWRRVAACGGAWRRVAAPQIAGK